MNPSWLNLVLNCLERLFPFVLVTIAGWFVVFVVRKWMGVKRTSAFLPKLARRPPLHVRTVDALLLVTFGLGIVGTFVAAKSGFDVSSWHSASPEMVGWNNSIAVGITGCVLACGLMTLCWRLGPGVVLSIFCLMVYGYFADAGSLHPPKPVNRPMPSKDECLFTIDFANMLEGVDLWINGVYFGQTPVKTTLGKLLGVPEWKMKEVSGKDRDLPGWHSLSIYWSEYGDGSHDKHHHRDLLFQMKLNGEPMLENIGVNGSGCTLNPSVRKWSNGYSTVSHTFDALDSDLKRLLQSIQLRDHRVDEAWATAYESFGVSGWNLIRDAAKYDPGCRSVLDQLVARKYGDPQAATPNEAWQVMERIAAAADKILDYSTDSLAGLAVDQFAPKLDPRRLAMYVKNWILNHPNVSEGGYQYGEINGRPMFAAYPRLGPREPGSPPQSAFAWTHAVWQLDRTLSQRDDTRDNSLEQILVPFLLIERSGEGFDRQLAMHLGGSTVGRWLRWKLSHPDPYHNSKVFVGNDWVDQGEWEMAQSNTPEGKKWRASHRDKVLEFAEHATSGLNDTWPRELEFLFLDFDGTDRHPAASFWPQFRKLVVKIHTGPDNSKLGLRWEYLSRIEPLPTVDMYFNCWLDVTEQSHIRPEIGSVLKRLPKEKSESLLKAILERVESDAKNDEGKSNRWQHEQRRQLWRKVYDEIVLSHVEQFVKLVEADERVTGFLEQPFDNAMFAELENVPSVKAKLVFIEYLRREPTPRHREWLAKLADDADEGVRSSAAGAIQDLQKQAAEPPMIRKRSPLAGRIGEVMFEEPPVEASGKKPLE